MPIILTPEQIPAINQFSSLLDTDILPRALDLFENDPHGQDQFLLHLMDQYHRAHSTYAGATLRLCASAMTPARRQAARAARKNAHHLCNIVIYAIGKRQYFSEVLALDSKTKTVACAEAFISLLDSAFSPDPREKDHCDCRQHQARSLLKQSISTLPGLIPLFLQVQAHAQTHA